MFALASSTRRHVECLQLGVIDRSSARPPLDSEVGLPASPVEREAFDLGTAANLLVPSLSRGTSQEPEPLAIADRRRRCAGVIRQILNLRLWCPFGCQHSDALESSGIRRRNTAPVPDT